MSEPVPVARRRLFLDIETSPIQVFVFRLNDKSNAYISHKSIIKDAGIICICWKWAGTKRVHSLTWDAKQSDKAMLKKFIPILDSATEIVMQGGDRFDLPWIRTECLVHGIPMAPKYPTVDTLKKSRQKFYFPSNRLDYLGNRLIGENKLPTTFGLWRDIVLHKSERSLRTMVRYCKQDVLLLEKVFDRMAPYIESASSIARYASDCPECGSSKTVVQAKRKRASGSVHITFRCKDCGRHHTMPESRFNSDKELPAA